jgi:outer membrane biosynthesis protein TonB
VSAVLSHTQVDLNEQIAQVRERLARLHTKQRATDAELERISGEREQHRLLSDICQALDKLEAQGAAHLFWGERATKDAAMHLERVRGTVTVFAEKINAIEQRRQTIATEIERHTQQLHLLNDELLEQKEREESAKYEFVVHRELTAPYRPALMPWSEDRNDRERFRKTLLLALLITSLLGSGVAIWQLPVRDKTDVSEIPERLVELVQREKPKPPEPKPVEQVRPDKEKNDTPTETQQARAKAEQSGLLAFKNAFKDLIDDDVAEKLGAASISQSGQQAAGDPRRALVVAQARAGSGGINTAAISRNVGGTGSKVGGVQFARVESSVGNLRDGDRPLSDGPGPSRTDEEIQIVFDRYKATLYRIYNRELRSDPTLRGKMVLRITIEPNGEVSAVRIESTDLASAALKEEVIDRVKRFNFGPKEGVPRVTILYPIDFLPAT